MSGEIDIEKIQRTFDEIHRLMELTEKLRRQVLEARARGDEETVKKLELQLNHCLVYGDRVMQELG